VKDAVVDASVAAKWVVAEDHSEQAASLLAWNRLHAPAHWRAEAVHVLWSKLFHGDLSAAEAEERMVVLMRAPVIDTPITGLLPRAFAISAALMITVYDSLYVALAEQRGIPLVTADMRLIRRLAGRHATAGGSAGQVVWIGDL
jgi:predicted nucleic acid-binding protein